jgi:hypothetical protein
LHPPILASGDAKDAKPVAVAYNIFPPNPLDMAMGVIFAGI